MDEKRIALEIINMSTNDKPGDSYSNVKELDPSLVSSMNKLVSLELIYELERNFNTQLSTIKKTRLWTERVSKFIHNQSIDYFNADKVKVPDSVFLSEIKTYTFGKNDVIADIGAGSGYFERVLSMYCDHLTVYANEINSSNLSQLKTRLKFLELSDQKDITYHAILGNENSSLLPSNTFDKVIVRNTYHHFSNPDKMVKDFKRILKKDGKLYIVDILTDETDKEPECKSHLTRKDFMKVINENGFRLVNETKLDYDNFKCFEFRLML
ncbi:MAG: class I SAM-dependent methyltransferase [Cyclobacteriaceae bacterium]|nr:class I SAM-dependent methyltransferase [Cyclobacteriaceae bacterium]